MLVVEWSETHMFNFRNFVLFLTLLTLATATAGASPIVMVSYNGSESGGTYGPYYLTVTNNPGLAPITGNVLGDCLTNLIKIPGSPWQAEEVSIVDFSNANPTTHPLVQLEELAYLNTRFGLTPQTDWQYIHQAMWNIALGNNAFTDSNGTGTSTAYWQLAAVNAHDTDTNFSLLIPSDGAGHYNFDQGLSQTFIIPGGGGNPPPVPEPATLLMVGSALIGVGVAMKKRLRKQ
jgi:hypothetical protein